MKKKYIPLIVSSILLIASIVLTLVAYNNHYKEALIMGDTIAKWKQDIQTLQDNATPDQIMAITEEIKIKNGQLEELNAQKLEAEKPYSYALTLAFFSVLFTLYSIYLIIRKPQPKSRMNVTRLAQAGLMAALCYIGFAFLKFDMPVGPEKTAFHFGNVFCVLGALLLGGFWGGLSGAIGMTVADLTTAYVTSAPKTFLLKMCIGLIVGFIAHVIFKISRDHHSKRYLITSTILSCAGGMIFNIIADPLVGYFYKMYLLGIPQDAASALAKMSSITTSVNAVTAVVFATIFYLALRPALKKSGLFIYLSPEKKESDSGKQEQKKRKKKEKKEKKNDATKASCQTGND